MARELKLGRRDAVTTTVNSRLAMEQLRLDTPYKALVGLSRRQQDQPEKGSVSFWRAVLGGRGRGSGKGGIICWRSVEMFSLSNPKSSKLTVGT